MGLASHSPGSTVCGCARGSNTSDYRFMDSHRRNARCGCRGMDGVLTTRRSVDLHLIRSSRRRPGTPRSGRLVSRCPPFWMEAPRHSISQELGLAPLRVNPYPLKRLLLAPTAHASRLKRGRQTSRCSQHTTASGVVRFAGSLHNGPSHDKASIFLRYSCSLERFSEE